MSDTNINSVIQYGTAAARAAFTPNPAVGSKILYIWYDSDAAPATWIWNSSAWVQINVASAATLVYPARCEGRLTLATVTPVTLTDQISKTNIYWTPCDSNLQVITNGVITLWNGSALVDVAITELTGALGTLTSGKNYDVFIDYNSGTPQIVFSAAWTNDTTRANALGSQYDSTRKESIIVKSGTSAYRWVGTFRTTSTTTTEDSGGITGTTQVGAKRFVYNAYNQILRTLKVIDGTDTWSYTTATVRQANGASGNQVEYVSGAVGTVVDATVMASLGSPTGTVAIGIGVDSTTVFQVPNVLAKITGGSAEQASMSARYVGTPGLGYHKICWLELGNTDAVWFGDAGVPLIIQSGMTAQIVM